MQTSIGDLLVCQVGALVSATADAVCSTAGKDVPSIEAQFYELLTEYCAEKHRLAAAAYADREAARSKRELIYW